MGRPGLSPGWLRVSGWVILAAQGLFIGRIVYESTVLTCWNGPQMVGFAMIHGAGPLFLLGLFFLPLGALFLLVLVVFGSLKRFSFARSEWLLLGSYVFGFVLLIVPYDAWQRADMKVCSAGPLGDHFLQVAALRGELGEVTKLVAQGHDVNHDAGDDETALTSAIRGRKYDVVRFLIGKGANVNQQGRLSGTTPLMSAARSGDLEVIQLLLEHGADPCKIAKYSDNETAQRIAEKEQHSAASAYLADHSNCPRWRLRRVQMGTQPAWKFTETSEPRESPRALSGRWRAER